MRWTASARRGTSRDRRSGLRSFERPTRFWKQNPIAASLQIGAEGRSSLSRLAMHKPRRIRPSLQASKALELRSAVAAADCGSVRGAAELLRLQQSSLSRTISELEHHLGVQIFERFSGGVRPTRPGCDVLRLARTILEEFDALIATARSVHNSETGSLSVGFCTSLSAGNLRASLLEFKERFPQIALARLNDQEHV